MMNPMQNKTPEERQAIAAKAVATRKANIAAKKAAKLDAIRYADGLREEIANLEEKLSSLRRTEEFGTICAALTGKWMLTQEEIAQSASPWESPSGVYFLLSGNEVIYVGQAANVYARIGQHKDKQFDRYAFVSCPTGALDVLESLYIHCLRPKLNGNHPAGGKVAPILLEALVGLDLIERVAEK